MFKCKECGSDSVQHAYWVELNEERLDEPYGSWCEHDNSWCHNCQEHTEIVEEDDERSGTGGRDLQLPDGGEEANQKG